MRIFLTLTFSVLVSISAFSQDTVLPQDSLNGLWLGTMKVSEQMSLQLAFEITPGEEGNYSAKMNVIEQKAFDIPMDECLVNGDSIHIRFNAAGINYNGFFSKEAYRILGTYAQGGAEFPLDLSRVDQLPLEVERPQTPVRPFPYEEAEISFENKEADITLAGTLTKPSDVKDLPGVVLIAGSGKNDRDETSMGHFLLLSDYLTRNGYAVLRYDKRGVGESGGEYGLATTFDFASDAFAALEFLKADPDTDPESVGLIGHSEGALIAPMLASEYKDSIAFIVMMGGLGIPGTDLLLIQSAKMARISGVPEEEIVSITEKNQKLYQIASSELDDSLMVLKCREAVPDLEENTLNMLKLPWFRTFLALDPQAYLSQVVCPALAITGEKDVQCPPEENLAAIESSLKKAGNKHYETKVMPGLNHLFQTAESGSPYEYEQIPEIISPDALEFIVAWLNGVNQRE